jgi:hypothetical protein
MGSRLDAIARARPEVQNWKGYLYVWNLRGYASDFASLRPELQRHLDRYLV